MRRLPATLAVSALTVLAPSLAVAQDAPRSATNNALADEMTPELNEAVDRGHEAIEPLHPRHTERVQDVSLGGLPAGPPLLDRVDRSRRHVGLLREIVLGPSEGLARGANAIHGGVL